MRKIKVGIVGTGAIAERAHIPILSTLQNARIEAICDADRARLNRRSQEWNITNTYTDYEEMYRSTNLDAVFVCVPTHLHYETVRAALEQGLNVFCEKPMGVAADPARSLVKLAERKSLILAVGYNKRLNNTYTLAKNALAERKFGNVVQAQAVLLTPGPYVDWIASTDWFFDKKGGGVLYDLVPHVVDLWNYVLAEEIVEANAKGTTSRRSLGVLDNISCVLRTAKGTIGTISVGWGAGASSESLQVHGSGGSFVVSPLGLKMYYGKVNPLNGSSSVFALLRKFLVTRMANVDPFKGIDDTYLKQDKAFIDSIAVGGNPSASGVDAVKVLEVIEAMKLSLDESRPAGIDGVGSKNAA